MEYRRTQACQQLFQFFQAIDCTFDYILAAVLPASVAGKRSIKAMKWMSVV